MTDAHATDFEAMGVPDRSPFDILGRPKAPLKPSPPRNRQGHTFTPLRGPVKNSAPNFNVPIATAADSMRTAAIKGKL